MDHKEQGKNPNFRKASPSTALWEVAGEEGGELAVKEVQT